MTEPSIYLWLSAITLVAATINGAIGYGFSSTTVPLALLFLAGRVLNPALVLAEVPMNLYVLAVNRRSARPALTRVAAMLVGLVPGVVMGSGLLASISADLAKLYTYAVILPVILLQAGGLRRPFRSERAVGIPFGAGLGLLYSTTTISGPPLAMMLNNQGLAKADFRAALGIVRSAESLMTAASYFLLGLYSPSALQLVPWIVPSIVVGIPLGAAIVRQVDAEAFRRLCMSFDAWIVGFGLARVIDQAGLVRGPSAYAVFVAVVVIDALLLVRFFRRRRRALAHPA